MTNGEYYRNTLTDREITFLHTCNEIGAETRLENAFFKWCESLDCGSTVTNTLRAVDRVNIWFWGGFHTRNGKWKENRTYSVRLQQFLNISYKKEYWD